MEAWVTRRPAAEASRRSQRAVAIPMPWWSLWTYRRSRYPVLLSMSPKPTGAAVLYRHEGVVDLKRPVPCPQVDVLWRPCVQLLFCVVSSVDGVDRLIEQRCQWDRVERLVGSDHHAPPPLFFGCSFTLPHSMPWGNWGCGLPDGLFFAIIYYQFPRQQPAWVKEGHFLAYWWKETAYGYVFSVGPGGGLVQHGRDGAADRGGAAVPGGP